MFQHITRTSCGQTSRATREKRKGNKRVNSGGIISCSACRNIKGNKRRHCRIANPSKRLFVSEIHVDIRKGRRTPSFFVFAYYARESLERSSGNREGYLASCTIIVSNVFRCRFAQVVGYRVASLLPVMFKFFSLSHSSSR